MASKKGFKPPVKKQVLSARPAQVKDDGKPLSNSQYEEIFDAVLHFQGSRSPVQAESMKMCATEPGESASTGNSQANSEKNPEDRAVQSQFSASTQSVALRKPTDSSSASVCSVQGVKPKFKRPQTLREALKVQETSSQFSSSLSQLGGSGLLLAHDAILSQPPKNLRHRERLQWLQDRRGVGLYIQCDICKKWRWSEIDDPVDVPKKWTCRQNPDNNYNQCIIPEKPISVYIEEDLIHNEYTAGSIVWAKLFGFPWWPAMVDDCPDTEQYYWLDGYSDIPTDYHVVFFDYEASEITRAWVPVRDLVSFKHQPHLDDKFSLKPGHKSRIASGKLQALAALKLRVQGRLQKYSFLARWSGEIVTPPASDSEVVERAARRAGKKRKLRNRGSQKEVIMEAAGDSSDEEPGPRKKDAGGGDNVGRRELATAKGTGLNRRSRKTYGADDQGDGASEGEDGDDEGMAALEDEQAEDAEDEEMETSEDEEMKDAGDEEMEASEDEEMEASEDEGVESSEDEQTESSENEEVKASEDKQVEASEDEQAEASEDEQMESSEDEEVESPQYEQIEAFQAKQAKSSEDKQAKSSEAKRVKSSEAKRVKSSEAKQPSKPSKTAPRKAKSTKHTTKDAKPPISDEHRSKRSAKKKETTAARSKHHGTAEKERRTRRKSQVRAPMDAEDDSTEHGGSQSSISEKSFEEITHQVAEIVGESICSAGVRPALPEEDQARDFLSTEAPEEDQTQDFLSTEAPEEDQTQDLLSTEAPEEEDRAEDDAETQLPDAAQTPDDEDTASEPDAIFSQDSPMESLVLNPQFLRDESAKQQHRVTQTLADHVDIFETSLQSVGDDEDEGLRRLQEHITRAQIAEPGYEPVQLTATHVMGARTMAAKKIGKKVGRQGEEASVKSGKRKAHDTSDEEMGGKKGGGEEQAGRSGRRKAVAARGKENRERRGAEKKRAGTKRPGRDGDEMRRKIARMQRDTGISDSKDAKSDTKLAKNDSKLAKNDSNAKSDTKIGKSDTKLAKSDANAKSDSKDATNDTKDAKSDSKAGKNDTKLATDSKTATRVSKVAENDTKVGKSDTKLARSDTKGAKSDTKLAKNDSKLAKNDSNAKSDTIVGKSDTKLTKSDTNAKSDIKGAKSDTKLAKSDTKLAKSDTKLAKNDSKLAKNDTNVAQNETIAKSDSKVAKSDSKLAKNDKKVAKNDTKTAKSDTNALSDSKVAKSDTKLAKTDTKITKTATKLPKSDTKPTKHDTIHSSADTNKPSTSGLQNTAKKSRKTKFFQPPLRKSYSESNSEENSDQHQDLTSSQSLNSSSVAVVPNSEDRLLDILRRLSQESLPFDP